MPEITGVSHVGLTVTDVDKSAEFYRSVLGLTEVVSREEPGHSFRLLMHAESGTMIGLNRWAGGDGAVFAETRTGLDHLSFGVPDRAALEEWAHDLRHHGVPCSPIVDAPYGCVLPFRDPDGIALELFAPPQRQSR